MAGMEAPAPAREVLDFWFGAPPHVAREAWFRKDDAFDAQIRTRFGDLVGAALAGALGDWCTTAHGSLARIVLLDQFTRNVFRGTPGAFAGDDRALGTALHAVQRGFDRELDFHERWFCYLPFEHSEDAEMQQRSLELFGALASESGDAGPLDWARRHADVIRRFGRYPHRNAILGRASTSEEVAYLREPGSSF
jgi:uncharacterized protein (DUF924 family)